MPLPDAVPKPAGSNIYHQLNAFKLGELTNEQLAIVRDPLYLNDRSEDELRRLALIGQARQSLSVSSSGPIPATAKVINTPFGASHTPDDGAYYSIFTPNAGEVWRFGGFFMYSAAGSTGFNLRFLDNPTSATAGTEVGIIIADGSSGDTFDNGFGPITFDENITLQFDPQGTITGDSTAQTYLYRVR